MKPPEPCFYTAAESVTAGEPLEVFAHCPAGGELSISRLGADRTPEPPVLRTPIAPVTQLESYDRLTGFAWTSQAMATDASWRPGLYLVGLSSRHGDFRQAVIVSSSEPADVGVVLATNTWSAYNDFGGLSNYEDNALPLPLRWFHRAARIMNASIVLGERHVIPTVPLPASRPNARINQELTDPSADPVQDFSHLTRAEWAVLRHLDRQGAEYNVFTDRELASDPRPSSAKLLVFAAHSEYWSNEMQGRLITFTAGGGRALFLSGNNWYRRVRMTAHGLEVVEQKTDPDHVARHLGAAYTAEGYESSAPYRVTQPEHPIFANTGLGLGDLFGGPGERGEGASGHETDKIRASSGAAEVLAIGCNAEGPAYLTWRDTGRGGWICNFGSVLVGPWVERCPRLGMVVDNIVELGRS